MRRRDFLGIMVGSTAAWPLAADAQQPSIPVVGFVNSSTANAQVLFAAAYRQGLEENGFIEGKNVLIESRWADGQYNRLPELIGDLIKRNVAVLMAGGPPAAIAASIRVPASSCGTSTSMWIRLRCGRGASIC